jgi:hypothetical protein
VKWLTNIIATTQALQGYWQTPDYASWDDSAGVPIRRPLAEMKLKSEIARPSMYETLEPGRPYTIYGAAWAGGSDVTEISISLDGGTSWVHGDFLDPIKRHSWRRWKYDGITPTKSGRYTRCMETFQAAGTTDLKCLTAARLTFSKAEISICRTRSLEIDSSSPSCSRLGGSSASRLASNTRRSR